MNDTTPSKQPNVAVTEKFLIFTIQERLYTLPSRMINEVTVYDKVYPLPLLPEYVKGIVNRYSVPYALIDLGLFMLKTPSALSKVVVLKEGVDKVAFMIDDVVDIVDVPLEHILKVEQGTENQDATVVIEASFEWHQMDVFLLSIREIINQIKKDFAA
ncbi:MAG: chemotaxis protein CheW [Treponema sp.]|jgi:purine-binding chemotaxis protein CheW|nr:chemotaxis protein CheW [Treponema sp.]